MKRTDSQYVKYILSNTYVTNSKFYTLPPDSNEQLMNDDGIPFVNT